ncbi:hypothetical protein, partial [Cronobacter malonaticus]|uniref:hypothetical protein n=2 Tax=Cronobacter malonaticus TaxID=413503 RepID=UPI001E35CB0B
AGVKTGGAAPGAESSVARNAKAGVSCPRQPSIAFTVGGGAFNYAREFFSELSPCRQKFVFPC